MSINFGDFAEDFDERRQRGKVNPPTPPHRDDWHHGELRRWKADRAFGFILPDATRAEDVFVHITALEAAGLQPVVGMRIRYMLGSRNGKMIAVTVAAEDGP